MYHLLLDTSTEKCFVAIAKGTEIVFNSFLPPGMQSAQLLLPELQRGFQATGLTLKDMSFVSVGVGPGSYTGIRVGATVAKTIAFSCGIPLVGVCSLDVFVPAGIADLRFASVIDAKIGGLYVKKGRAVKGELLSISTPSVCSLPEAAAFLQDVSIIVTPSFGKWRSKLEALGGGASWQWVESYPSPVQMAVQALKKYADKDYSLDGKLELLYMRKTQAEIEKEAKGHKNNVKKE